MTKVTDGARPIGDFCRMLHKSLPTHTIGATTGGRPMTFGDKLRELREGMGVSRQALAEASGVTFATIHGYEIGRRAPSFSNVVRLAKSLGVDCTAFSKCEDIASEEEEKPAPKRKGKK